MQQGQPAVATAVAQPGGPGQPIAYSTAVVQPGGQIAVATTVANPGGTRHVTDAEIEETVSGLFGYGVGLLISGIICALTFWAVYYMGAALAGLAIFTGSVQMSHSGSANSVRSNRCCFSPTGVFNNLYISNLITMCCGGIGLCICALLIWLWGDFWFRYVAIVGAIGCLGCSLFSGMSFLRCSRLHLLLKQDIDLNPAVTTTSTTTTVGGQGYPQAQSYPAVQPVVYVQPQADPYTQQPQQQQMVYGQPQQQQMTYGQPQQQMTYGQPQQQMTYGQPQQQQPGGMYGNKEPA